jgi:hypothetical protein
MNRLVALVAVTLGLGAGAMLSAMTDAPVSVIVAAAD